MDKPVVAQRAPIPVQTEAGKSYWWCVCGLSKGQPFCDGSHKGTGFAPMQYEAEASARKFFCACKATATQPFCDGTHNKIED